MKNSTLMTNSNTSFIERLNAKHHLPVDFSMDQAELGAAARLFLRFLSLPSETKRQLHFAARSHRASADGYTDKSRIDQKDPKQFFHWSPYLMSLPQAQSLADKYEEVNDFFEAANNVYSHVETTLLKLFNNQLLAYKDNVFSNEKLTDGILRFLCYSPRKEQSFCARAHFDKGFSTLAIADSAPGLRIGCGDFQQLKAVKYGNGTALFMPAWMLFEASDRTIKPAWHDVIHAPSEQNVNSFCARWSIVFFVNAPDAAFSSWNEVHTPLH